MNIGETPRRAGVSRSGRIALANRSPEPVAAGYGPALRAHAGFAAAVDPRGVPALEMGTHAVELLLERIATPDGAPRHLLLAPPVSLRDSTGPAPLRRPTAVSPLEAS